MAGENLKQTMLTPKWRTFKNGHCRGDFPGCCTKESPAIILLLIPELTAFILPQKCVIL